MIYFASRVRDLEARLAAAEAEVRAQADTRWHIESLEAQVSYLKEKLAEGAAGREHIKSLEEQIAYFRQQLIESKAENRDLLDRLLAKNNVAPISASSPKSTRPPEIITPFGVTDAEVQSAFKESWIREEIGYIMNQLACDEGTARGYAEQNYVQQHQVIK